MKLLKQLLPGSLTFFVFFYAFVLIFVQNQIEDISNSQVPSVNDSTNNPPYYAQIFTPNNDQIKFDPNQLTRMEDSNWTMYSDHSPYIYHLVQDGEYMYVGLSGMGLAKYHLNNKSIEAVYTMRDGLLSNSISSLLLVNSELWVGCQGGGITKISLKDNSLKQYTDKAGLPDLRNIDLSFDGKTIWVGTANGVARYDRSSDIFISYQQELLPTATKWSSRMTTNENGVWTTLNANDYSSGGVAIYKPENDAWESYGIEYFDKDVSDFRIDFSGEPLITNDKVWIITLDNLLFEFDTQSKKWLNRGEIADETNAALNPEAVTTPRLLRYEPPFLLIAGGDAIYAYDLLEKKVVKYIDQTLIPGFTKDRLISYEENTLWFYKDDVLHRYNDTTQKIDTYNLFPQTSNVPNEIYGLITKTNTDLVFHTDRGYELYSPNDDHFEIIFKKTYIDGSPIPATGVYNNNNTVWIYDSNCYNSVSSRCTPPSLWQLNIKDKQLTLIDVPEDQYFSRLITVDSSASRLFFSTSRGYAIYNIDKNDWDLHLDILDYYQNFLDFQFDSEQNIWVRTSEGLGILNGDEIDYIKDFPQDINIQNFSLQGNYIWIVAEDLYQYDLAKKIYQVIELPSYENLLPKDDYFTTRGIAFGHDTIWLSTNLGIFKYDDSKWEVIDHRNGLYTNKISGIYVVGNNLCMLTNARNYGLICSKSTDISTHAN